MRRRLNPNKRNQCFEIFGYDFIIDAEFNTWLIEANTNPCLEESSQLLKMLLPRMLNDAFKLTVDVVFKTYNLEPKEAFPRIEQPYRVNGYPDSQNMWQLLCALGSAARPHVQSPTSPHPLADAHSSMQSPVKGQTSSFMSNNRNSSAQTAQGLRKFKVQHNQHLLHVDVDHTAHASYTPSQIMRGFTEETQAALHLVNQYEMRAIEKSRKPA